MPRHLQKDWNLSPTEAVATQQRLRHEVRIEPLEREVRFIGGADVSFNRFSDKIYTGIVVLDLATLKVVESVGVRSVARFPYIPGLLSFREAPSVIAAWDTLQQKPDLLMLDGQGIAHPRRFGIACHIGVLLDLPTVGCAKSLLVGHHDDLPTAAGKHVPLIHREEEIGVALRTKRNVAPIFVSVGHLIDLPSAIEIVKKSTGKYRQPEPTRQAHLLVNQLRRDDDAKAAKAGASQ
jgi:deoxyribonuclease V